jgi:hypothetical protein
MPGAEMADAGRSCRHLPAAASQLDALLAESTRELIAQARAATRKVNRVGFRRDDLTDPSMLLSLRSAVAGSSMSLPNSIAWARRSRGSAVASTPLRTASFSQRHLRKFIARGRRAETKNPPLREGSFVAQRAFTG